MTELTRREWMRWGAVGATVGSSGCMRTMFMDGERTVSVEVEAVRFDWYFHYDAADG